MRCPGCEHDNPAHAKFCAECGTVLAIQCPECATTLPATAKFCVECGHRVGAATDASTRFRAPDAYTPQHLAEKIAGYRSAFEAERKQVTVLFADLKGSLELLADRDPEEAREILDLVLDRMMDAVHQYEGTVNQIMGDGIMALFGAPLAHEDHALRACHAALRMQESIRSRASEVRQRYGVDLEIRVGLNSGEVVLRSIGSDLSIDYTAVGQTTHLASRMEQLAPPGCTFLTEDTLRLVEPHVEVVPHGKVFVKGLATPVAVHELRGVTAIRSRIEADAARGLTRFVGREHEMKALADASDSAASGRGQVVAIVGEPGIGKSRLVWEFRRARSLDGWLVLDAQPTPYGRGSPYLPIIELLRQYFALGLVDAPSKTRERIAAALGPDEAERFVSPLLALLGVPPSDGRWDRLDAGQRRRRTLDAVKHLLTRPSHARAVCIVVEDLHWIDPETQAVLDAVVESVAMARVLVVVTYRPEYEHAWGAKSYYRQVRLDPLSAPGSEMLLDALLGSAAELAPLRSVLVERTEGNPFFLEETVRDLAETDVLYGARGAYRLNRQPSPIRVPETIHAVLAARIDRLHPDDKRVLQAAAAVGRDVSRALLGEIVDVPERDLEQSLARLQAGEFIYERQVFPEVEYTFRHALTLEVAYSGLLRERRYALDRAILDAIERRFPEHPADLIDRLAHHAVRGEMWDRAVAYCREAGTSAFARSAHRTAVTYFEQALAALGRLPSTKTAVEQAIDIRIDLRYALSPLGEYRKMLDSLTEARSLAQKLEDRRRLGVVSSFLCNYFTLRGDFAHAIEDGSHALAIAEELGDVGPHAVASAFLALAYYGTGQYRESVAAGIRTATLEGDLRRRRFGMVMPPAVYGRVVTSWSLAELGDFARARQVADEAIALAETLDHPHSVIFACLGLGTVHLRRGELDAAVGVLERAYAAWQTADLPAVLLELASSLGSAYAQIGRAADAIDLLERAVAQAVALGHRFGHVLRTGGIAEAYLAAGRVEDAMPLAQFHLAVVESVNARGRQAWGLHLLAEIAAQRDPVDAASAERSLDAAIALAHELGMRPLDARCQFTRGCVLARLGRRAEARAVLTDAAERFRALDMTAWSARATAHAERI